MYDEFDINKRTRTAFIKFWSSYRWHIDQDPFSVGQIRRNVSRWVLLDEIDQKSVVATNSFIHWKKVMSVPLMEKKFLPPRTKFEFTSLIIERKPSYIDLAGTFEYTRRNIQTSSSIIDHHICTESTVESFIGTLISGPIINSIIGYLHFSLSTCCT